MRITAVPETADARSEARALASWAHVQMTALIAAGALLGLGVILWVAANWSDFGKFERFGLVASVIGAAAFSGIFLARTRVPAALIGVSAVGGLLALFGQTYPTDANAYELFALWAALSLPWVLAARHDSVWVLWTIILFTGLPLWVDAQQAFTQLTLTNIAPAWAIAAAVPALFSPKSSLARWFGGTLWAYRLSVVLALILVVTYAVPAVFESVDDAGITLAGLAVLGLAVTYFALSRPFDLPLLACATLALDVLLMSIIVENVMESWGRRAGGAETMLTIGILSAIVFVVSALGVLRLARARGAGVQFVSGAQSWPVTVLSAVGAFLTALPFLAFIVISFGEALAEGVDTYVTGGVVLAASAAAIRRWRTSDFVQQLALIWLLVGLMLTSFAFYRDVSVTSATLAMLTIVALLGAVLPSRWIAALLGVVGAGLAVLFIADLGAGGRDELFLYLEFSYLVVAAAGAATLVLVAVGGKASDPSKPAIRIGNVESFAAGWAAAVLLAVMLANPTFLLGGGWSGLSEVTGIKTALEFNLTVERALSVVMVAVSLFWLLRRLPELHNATAYGLAAVLTVLSYVMATLGAPLAMLAAALTTRRRVLAILATLSVIWVIGSFYYWLGWPLIQKAYLLMALGVALAAVTWLNRTNPDGADVSAAIPLTRYRLGSVLILATAVSTAAVTAIGIQEKEEVIENGQRVYVALAPVDPRSLMQGDYMRLRFALPSGTVPRRTASGRREALWAIATVDENEVATVTDVATDPENLASGEIALKLRFKQRRPVLGSTAYFFEEGTAAQYENARFGEFRVGGDGLPILVGLTGEDLQRIE